MRRGFTLIEALVYASMMSLMVVILFTMFAAGVSNFRQGVGRIELQGEARRILAPLRRDLFNSSYASVSHVARTYDAPRDPMRNASTRPVQRDGLCFRALRPGGSHQFDADSGLPRWDCYCLYFATADMPEGRMVKALVSDGDPPTLDARPMSGLLAHQAAFLRFPNPANLLPGQLHTFSRQVLEFAVTPLDSDQSVQIKLVVRGAAGRLEMGHRSSAEILELNLTIRPVNTYPRL
jgi:hypothetical protein